MIEDRAVFLQARPEDPDRPGPPVVAAVWRMAELHPVRVSRYLSIDLTISRPGRPRLRRPMMDQGCGSRKIQPSTSVRVPSAEPSAVFGAYTSRRPAHLVDPGLHCVVPPGPLSLESGTAGAAPARSRLEGLAEQHARKTLSLRLGGLSESFQSGHRSGRAFACRPDARGLQRPGDVLEDRALPLSRNLTLRRR